MRESELVAMRTLTGHVEALGSQIDALRADMREVRDKVIKFEAADLKAEITSVKGVVDAQAVRITALETAKSAAIGAHGLATEVRLWMPTVVILVAMLLFYFKNA